jgi:peptidylprolyl isomerase
MSASTETAKADDLPPLKPENLVYIDLDHGRVKVQLLPEIAPKHVERIKTLMDEGFYTNITFHRVICGFMAQTGDPTGTGRGGSDYPDVDAEFSDYKYRRGTLGMARTSDPNSANSQFFICFTDDGCSFLTGQYTVFGQVIAGMDDVDLIEVGEPPPQPSKIIHMQTAFKNDPLLQESGMGDVE